MINNKKIVVVTPAGRKRYMEILLKYILRERNIIDEYRIWVNTNNKSDQDYFDSIEEKYKGFVTLDKRFIKEEFCGTNSNIHKFFDKCTDSDTVYIRLDDDVVWLSENFIANLAEYRIKNPKPFLVYPTIINNGICDSILQNQGFYQNLGDFNYDCTGTIAFTDPIVCEQKHKEMIDKLYEVERINELNTWILRRYERVSINCISWLGETFAEFSGIVDRDEEHWLSCVKPKELGIPNVITGISTCSHFAFGPQREHMDKTNVLELYQNLSEYIDIDLKSLDFSKVDWKSVSERLKMKIHMLLSKNNIKY